MINASQGGTVVYQQNTYKVEMRVDSSLRKRGWINIKRVIKATSLAKAIKKAIKQEEKFFNAGEVIAIRKTFPL